MELGIIILGLPEDYQEVRSRIEATLRAEFMSEKDGRDPFGHVWVWFEAPDLDEGDPRTGLVPAELEAPPRHLCVFARLDTSRPGSDRWSFIGIRIRSCLFQLADELPAGWDVQISASGRNEAYGNVHTYGRIVHSTEVAAAQ